MNRDPLAQIPSRALQGLEEQAHVTVEQPVSRTRAAADWLPGSVLADVAITPVTLFVWKGEHRHGDIRWAIVAKFQESSRLLHLEPPWV